LVYYRCSTDFFAPTSGLSTNVSVLNTSSEGSFALAVPISAAISTTRTAASRRLCTRARSYLWTEILDVLCVKAMTITPGSLQGAEVADSDALANASEYPVKPAPRNERVQLVIDSLQHYDPLKPIPVVVQSLGDKIFTVEAPDLDLSMTGNSLGSALLSLKDRITTIYEEYRIKKTMDREQERRLDILQMYIGKTRRNWR
jgi:hypothetical protein